MGDYEVGDLDGPKRGYTTRSKEEQRRTGVGTRFTGLVRGWEKRWVKHGHLTVLRWERVAATRTTVLLPEGSLEEPAIKRPRTT